MFASAMPSRRLRLLHIASACALLVLGACATRAPERPSKPAPVLPAPPPPTATRGEFNIEAIPLDVWNAIGDIVVRTPQARYDSRSQMLGLYSVQYRGENLLILSHALPLSDTIHVLTTQVTARSPSGAPIDSDVAAELLAILQRELPAEVQAVRARQAAADAAEKAKAKQHKAKKHAKPKKK
jgi:hypothetical protein